MLLKYCLALYTFLLLSSLQVAWGQEAVVQGVISDSLASPIEGVSVQIHNSNKGTSTNIKGFYKITVPAGDHIIVVSHIEYKPLTRTFHLNTGDTLIADFVLHQDTRVLEHVEVSGKRDDNNRSEAGLIKLDPKTAQAIPSPFNDFTKILATLPGVVSNNELSSSYSVRGGNFDENQVYVNDIPVYRPFLVSSGQQEGLSFINPDMVSDVSFSSGGWQAKYGDKLSSNLNVRYKRPERMQASLTASLLGGAAHLEGATADQRFTYTIGARLKSSQYLLNTLETNGQYLPRFTDVQSYLTFDLDGDPHQTITELGLLTAYASNRYLVRPESQETYFGTLQQTFRLGVYYEGQEILRYRTFQNGIKLFHRFSQKLSNKLMASWVTTQEREYYDLDGAYRLSQVALDPSGKLLNDNVSILGVGENYEHARNKLAADIVNLENRTAWAFNAVNTLEFGVGFAYENIQDQLQQYSFSDSADYVTWNGRVYNQLHLNSQRFFAFAQNSYEPNDAHTLNYGVRVNYWTVNQQWLLSPRLQYAWKPRGTRNMVFRFATGLYQQPPFYRELRDREGNLHQDVKAQSSIHTIAGMDYRFTMFGREFTFLTEMYYKYLYHVIPYDVDNVRIRYFAENNAKAYATGVDFRINGEFIEGAESWFSLGILRTREDIAGDGRGYIRRPSDQLINLGIFFQDHLPDDPSVRVYLSVLYGSGLPFGPPDTPEYRGAYNGADYKRVDIGFSKQLFFRGEKTAENSFLQSLWVGAELLNALGADNTISYTWITDVNSNQFAVPNRLSARFLNLKIIARY